MQLIVSFILTAEKFKIEEKLRRWKKLKVIKKTNKNISLSYVIKNILIIIGMIVLVDLAVSFTSVKFIGDQVNDYMESTSDYYVNELNDTFATLYELVGNVAIYDANTEILRYSQDSIKRINASQNMNEKFELYRKLYGSEYKFLFMEEETEAFITSERGTVDYKRFIKMNKEILALIKDNYENSDGCISSKWTTTKVLDEWIAYKYFYYNQVYVCAYIGINDLAKSVNMMRLGEESYVVFFGNEQTPFNNEQKLKENNLYNEKKDLYNLQTSSSFYSNVLTRELDFATFDMAIVVKNNDNIIQSLKVQILLMLLLLVAIGGAGILVYFMLHKIIRPMKYFSENLALMEANKTEVFFEDNGIVELQEANNLFRKIVTQMKLLKIEMYEQDLAKKQLQVDFLKLQIQPHFYINCMSLIYNMACMGDFETIQKLASCVSDYFRYVFKRKSEDALLENELAHIANYLEICKIRYQSRIQYEIIKEGNLEGIVIPSLLLHTFVENSVKYGTDDYGESNIMICVERMKIDEVDFVNITVGDKGKGYSQQVLDQLQSEESIVTEKGTRIGIHNCIVRLRLIYGERARFGFYNRAEGGALVKICIPIQMENKHEHTIGG